MAAVLKNLWKLPSHAASQPASPTGRIPGSITRYSIGLALIVPFLAGCGVRSSQPTARLAGAVTIAGQPLPADAEGTIQFMPNQSGQAPPAFTTIVNGRYETANVPLGSVTVVFNIQRLTGKMVREDNAPGATPYPERENLVPPRHASGIRIEVTGDDNGQDFNL
jgi:hypothetical protein